MATLPQTVASLQTQVCDDYEHVFVDGGSIDGTLEYVRSLAGNVKVVENVAGGISRAMNVGIEHASGEIVAHLHSDDYYPSPDVLSKVEASFRLNPEAQWLFGRCISNVEGVERRPIAPQIAYSYERLLRRNFIPHPATFVRRGMFSSCGKFDESIKYAMDYDLWLRFGRVSAPLQLDAYLAVFRVHPGSLSSANRLAAFEDDYSVRKRYLESSLMTRLMHFGRYHYRKIKLVESLKSA